MDKNKGGTVLLVVAHGSRRESSNEEVRALAQQIQTLDGCNFTAVNAAFLELAEPSIPDGVSQSLESGADRVLVMPYFLSRGRHVVEDIPAELDKARAKHPDAEIELCGYLGGHGAIPQLLLTMAREHGAG